MAEDPVPADRARDVSRAPGAPGVVAPARPVRQRGWLEVRWRQFRNPPRPVFRAVLADSAVAIVLGVLYLAYDVALTRGADWPDYRMAAAAGLVLAVVVAGSTLTYLIVPQPGARTGGRPERSLWSAALGFFASLPIAYLTLVAATQLLKPLFV